jgi:mannose-6-phosphate isomerase-like protein (cupin superfamily)
MYTLKTKDWFDTDGFPIAVERRDPQEHFELHVHDFYEIVIVVGGRAFHVTRRYSWPLGAGDVLIVGGSEVHQYREIKDLRLISILFRPEKLHMEVLDLSGLPGYQALFSFGPSGRERNSQKRFLQLSSKELSVALNYVETLDHELKMRNPGFAFMACAWFMQLVGYLSRAYSQFHAMFGVPPSEYRKRQALV